MSDTLSKISQIQVLANNSTNNEIANILKINTNQH